MNMCDRVIVLALAWLHACVVIHQSLIDLLPASPVTTDPAQAKAARITLVRTAWTAHPHAPCLHRVMSVHLPSPSSVCVFAV